MKAEAEAGRFSSGIKQYKKLNLDLKVINQKLADQEASQKVGSRNF